MPLDRLFSRAREEEAIEDAEELEEIKERLGEVHDQLDVFTGTAWDAVERMLREEQQAAFTDMMSGEADDMILARERARVVARILSKPERLRQERDQLRQRLAELEE